MEAITRATLNKILSKSLTLKKPTRSIVDKEVVTTWTSSIITGEIQQITSSDLLFLPAGTLEVGDIRGFFLPDYYAGTIKIEEGDIIVWDSEELEIYRVLDHIYKGRVIYKEAFLKRL